MCVCATTLQGKTLPEVFIAWVLDRLIALGFLTDHLTFPEVPPIQAPIYPHLAPIYPHLAPI